MKLLDEIEWKDVPGDKSFADIVAHMHRFGGPTTPHQVIGNPLPTDSCYDKGTISKEKLTELGFPSVQDPSLKEMLIEQLENEIRLQMSGPFKKGYMYFTGAILAFTKNLELYPCYRDYEDLQGINSNGNDAVSSISSPAPVSHGRQPGTKPKKDQEIKKDDPDTHKRDEEDRQQTVRRQAQVQIQAEDDKDEDDKKQEERRLWYRKQLRLWQQKNNEREP